MYRKHGLSPKSQFYTTLACNKRQFAVSLGSARLVDATAILRAYNPSRRTREIGIRGDRVGDGFRRRAAHEFHAVQCRRRKRFGLYRRRAVVVSGNHAGGLRARATSIPDCANASVALRVANGAVHALSGSER